jgi:uncharacterized MnhB-related membrane protein
MVPSLLLLDVVLGVTLVAIALRVLLARDLFQSIVLFIILGMLLGIAWCRLEAVDVALAEVAIGAGLTGALFLNTLAATRGPAPPEALSTSARGVGPGRHRCRRPGRRRAVRGGRGGRGPWPWRPPSSAVCCPGASRWRWRL